ncbi:GNAT family N-acetyltransferase [Roseococcus sp. DSY-14]|uniref:GNAT family N-acetyltransferase n=1 Tax=Roseococcus sp. DSY-14 TaxID=3369650 RepID=UPI00387B667C
MNPAEGVRRARAGDETLLRDITRAAYARWVAVMGREPAPMRDDFAARVAAGQAWLLGEDALCVLEEKPDALLLDNVAVRPGAQGRGLGRQLIAFAEQEARARGHRVLRLYTNARMASNLALYEGLGFAETRREEHEEVGTRVWMEKPLP